VGELALARDLQDKRVVDRNNRELGRVDRVVLGETPGGPPRVLAIEIGPSALGARLHPVVGRIARALEHIFRLEEGRPVRVEVDRIEHIQDSVKLDLTAGETAALAVEQRLRPFVKRLSGG
jgi:sporulation protein YlmC with PRC-barrel domain